VSGSRARPAGSAKLPAVSSFLPGGARGAPQLVPVPVPAAGVLTLPLLNPPPSVTAALETVFVSMSLDVNGFTRGNPYMTLDWRDQTGQLIYSLPLAAPNFD
jgi:hypothetical protein